MEGDRADPFSDDLDLSDFKAKTTKKPPVPKDAIRSVSEANQFPSRAPAQPPQVMRPQRRYRTGRNVQFNTKVTRETAELAYRLQDETGLVMGELLERALTALDRELAAIKLR